jgi:hypothetical protein
MEGFNGMATLTDLVEAVARVEGMDTATVALFARTVREAGLIRTAGRGLSAAHMNFVDAANLLIAVNASMSVREAPTTVRIFRALRCSYHTNSDAELPHLRRDKYGWVGLRDIRFGHALEQLLQSVSERASLDMFLSVPLTQTISRDFAKSKVKLEIEFNKPIPLVSIDIYEQEQELADPPAFGFFFTREDLSSPPSFKRYPQDRNEKTQIGYRTVRAIADCLGS